MYPSGCPESLRRTGTSCADAYRGIAKSPPDTVVTPSSTGLASCFWLDTTRLGLVTENARSSSASPCSDAYTSTPPCRTQPAAWLASSAEYGLVGVNTNIRPSWDGGAKDPSIVLVG